MAVLFATSNPHKLEEVRAVLTAFGFDVIGLSDLGTVPDPPVEDGETFEENAAIKALAYSRATGMSCVAEDSGLVVDALDGAPGVYSARFAQMGETREERDRANNDRLLRELYGVPDVDRTARFISIMTFVDRNQRVVIESRGEMKGIIAHEPRGTNGFGYDPLLYLPDVGKTAAELTPQEKNARSHRGEAAREMAIELTTAECAL